MKTISYNIVLFKMIKKKIKFKKYIFNATSCGLQEKEYLRQAEY